MPNQALSGGDAVRYLSRNPQNCANPGISGVFRCKITRRRPPWKTLSHCKNTVSGSRCAARRTTRWCAARANTPTISPCPARPIAWMVRSSHAHGIIKGIDTGRRQGDAGRARRLDRQGPGSRRLQPLHLRPAAEEPRRLAAAADQPHGAGDRQGALRRRSRRLRGRGNAGAGARRGGGRRTRHRAAARRDRCGGG